MQCQITLMKNWNTFSKSDSNHRRAWKVPGPDKALIDHHAGLEDRKMLQKGIYYYHCTLLEVGIFVISVRFMPSLKPCGKAMASVDIFFPLSKTFFFHWLLLSFCCCYDIEFNTKPRFKSAAIFFYLHYIHMFPWLHSTKNIWPCIKKSWSSTQN